MAPPSSATHEPVFAAAAIPANARRRRTHEWNHISISTILRYQHWGGLLLFIPAVVITAVSHWTFQQRPVIRQALYYDASISYPMRPDTVANSIATLFNWLLLLAVLCIVELAVFRREHSLTVAVASILHHGWCCLIGFMIVIAVAEVTKPFSGELRPDFLARCLGAKGFEDLTAVSMSSLKLAEIVSNCQESDVVTQGRLSFPSGHSSNTMSVAWYTAIYLMWSLYLRHDAPCPRRLYAAKSFGARLVQEVWYALAYGLVLVALCLSWFIGMTRFWDDVHNIWDIVGGWLLAIIFTTPVVLKAIGLNQAFILEIDGPPDVLPLHAPAAAAAADEGVPPAVRGRHSLSPAGAPNGGQVVLEMGQQQR